ncbi:MAG: inner membrane CreD family protein [Actinomycetota bacterium]|nr:inner membrane CreD family protein [Actinomycetota bacterium]
MRLAFPTPDGVYDAFTIQVGGHSVPVRYEEGVAVATFDVPPASTASIATGYKTQGQDEWRYAPANEGVAVVEDFTLAMRTGFDGLDFPDGTVSPVSKRREGDGWVLTWDYDSLVSGRQIGVRMPKPINPGPVASRISMFAPVSLLFFFAALILVSATRGVRVHPMNYGFLAAGFFAFHLLFAYLVDRVDIGVAFAIGSVVSVALCMGYLRLFVKDARALGELAASQLIFLVLFSFTFFFEGLTGLAITIGSVITLGYFMARTGGLDWEAIFARSAEEKRRKALERFPTLDQQMPPTPPSTG